MLLRDWREKQGLSQKEMAEKIGVYWTTVWRWEARHTKPGAADLDKIAKLTNGEVTPNDFFDLSHSTPAVIEGAK